MAQYAEDVPAELPEDVEDQPGNEPQPETTNAFSAMMAGSASHRLSHSLKPIGKKIRTAIGRDGLGVYLTNPKSPLLLYANDFAVAIRDGFPKASMHALLLPRDQTKTRLHPFDAFEDAAFLATVRQHADELRRLVASDLRQKFGQFSQLEKARRDAMEAADESGDGSLPELPAGRDWEKEVMVGIHAGPSMNHLHVHVISVDQISDCMKKRNHYNSFKTPFFVRLDEFPLPQDDQRRKPDRGGWTTVDLKCWRCGKNFRNRFVQLKAHLQEEFEIWKRI